MSIPKAGDGYWFLSRLLYDKRKILLKYSIMAKLHEKLGLSEEQLQQLFKDPNSFDPQLREKVLRATRFSGTKALVGIVAGVVLFIVSMYFGINYYTSIIIEQTAELPGDPQAFDPVASLPAVQAHAGAGAELLSLEAHYLKSDGSMDLTVTDPYSPRAEYEFFIRDDANGKAAPPLGAGGVEGGFYYKNVSVDVYQPGQWRHVRSMGSEYSYQNKGMDRDESILRFDNLRPAPLPSCTFGEIWQQAIELGAPSNALADISYSLTYQGEPRYEFRISDSDYEFTFDADCQIVN